MKARTPGRKLDAGKGVKNQFDLSRINRSGQAQRRVNVDFPTWIIDALDLEAERLGVTRQSIIKVWIAERLEQNAS